MLIAKSDKHIGLNINSVLQLFFKYLPGGHCCLGLTIGLDFDMTVYSQTTVTTRTIHYDFKIISGYVS